MSSPLRIEKQKAAEPAPAATPRRQVPRKVVVLTILALLVIVGGLLGVRTVLFYKHHATTDDAQIDSHIDPVLPRVSGYVAEVLVKDNQPARAGDVLVRIDPRDLQAKVDQEQAALLNAEAAVAVARAAVAGTQANVASARAKASSSQADLAAARTRQQQTAADLSRYQALYAKEEVSQQQYDAANAAADAARAAVEAAGATSQSS